MPEKTWNERIRRAKREGVTPAVKESDLGRTAVGTSRHALKKSRHLVGRTQVAGRHVTSKAPPGWGGSRPRAEADTVVTRSDREARRRLPLRLSNEGAVATKRRPVATVRGRKKSPSRMNIKGKGGPRQKSRLHGG